MGKRAFVLSPEENYWRGFLLDMDCMESSVLPRYLRRAVPMQEKKDPGTVAESWDLSRTVVTSNRRDFVRYTVEFQRKDNNAQCSDCWGLVTVPNTEHDRAQALQKASIQKGVVIAGALIPWKAVAYANLCVSIERHGKVTVARFERCQFCEARTPLLDADWYKSLRVLRRSVRPASI